MSMRFRTVLFDLDGTLIDHFAAIHRCHTYAMTRLGLPAPTYAQVRSAVGGGVENAIRQLAGPGYVAAILPLFRAHSDATMLDDVVLLPGACELLTALRARGVRTAVLTNKLGTAARRICEHLALAPLLDAIVGAQDTEWLKPAPALTRHVLVQLGVDVARPGSHAPADTLFVGDSPYDVQTAHQAGLPCWCVTTGTHTAGELHAAHADAVYASLNEVAAALA